MGEHNSNWVCKQCGKLVEGKNMCAKPGSVPAGTVRLMRMPSDGGAGVGLVHLRRWSGSWVFLPEHFYLRKRLFGTGRLELASDRAQPLKREIFSTRLRYA